MTVNTSLLSLIGDTPMLKLSAFDTGPCELFVKLESQNPGGSIKDRVGLAIIEEAEKSGELKPGGTIIEATAGNTGIGLALVAAIKGYKIILVIPDKMSREKILHLEGLGAEIILTRSDVPEGHPEYYQDLARRIVAETPGSFLANQFSNPANPMIHRTTTGPEIWEQMDGNLDAVVAGVGSGGTITGLAEFFKEKDPNVQMVAADPKGSIVADAIIKGSFSYEGGTWLVEGVGEDFIPDNLNVDILHDAEVVTDKEAFQTLQVLIREEGVLGGSSTGTLVAGAVKWCQKQTTPKRVVTFICDTGNKYLSKAFNKSWLHDNDLLEVKTAGDVTDLINRRADQGDMISVSVSDTLLTAYKRMRASDISQIPVLDGERLVGVLDEEDLLFNVSKSKAAFTQSVVDFMVTDLDVLPVGASEEELLNTLTQGKVAIIYQGDTFVGFITKVDLINHYRTKISED
ncbi:MAG: pyridoxal-phosphate dependent enzyme [Porticoccaceae bacterium]|nr:pyridoxal-phosphate dependent enzyme [Porticoccaceae bacterium]MBT7167571.1 pyridoxal-phosphate dependent enzyme [Porticoccaceae bacterium]MBT7964423.1 pyridoxal-phosphate dependent enzyme [Porticoccaceae bacterium]